MMLAKYILSPDYKPMYALAKQFGPKKGPLETPTLIEVDTIHDILTQDDPPRLFEVVPTNPALTKYGKPVEITLENFKKTYDEIVADLNKSDEDDNRKDPETPPVTSDPTPENPTDPPSEEQTGDDFTEEELAELKAEYGEDA